MVGGVRFLMRGFFERRGRQGYAKDAKKDKREKEEKIKKYIEFKPNCFI
jgi:hypothetical protein